MPAAAPGVPPADLGSLQPLLAAQAEALSAELQAIFAARLELLFKPLQDLVAAVESWTVQVSSLWKIAGAAKILPMKSLPLPLLPMVRTAALLRWLAARLS